MLENDSRLFEDMNFTSWIRRSASSSGSVTFFSTSPAEAPGNTVVMMIQLKLMVGSCWRGNAWYDRVPMTSTRTKVRLARTWLRSSDW